MVFDSPEHRSVVDSWEPKFAATEQTEPICRLKPNAQAEVDRGVAGRGRGSRQGEDDAVGANSEVDGAGPSLSR